LNINNEQQNDYSAKTKEELNNQREQKSEIYLADKERSKAIEKVTDNQVM
jgi:hypothetical protein